MILHDAVVIPGDVTSVTNPLLQGRKIVSRVEIGHRSISFRLVVSVLFGHPLIRIAFSNI